MTKATPQQINKYEAALQHLEEAKKLLNEIGKENQRDYDADHFAYQVDMIISHDHGECGLAPFIAKIS